jgi:hypothetical protein
MKKQTVKKLRIGKETLLPLESPQLREVAGGVPPDPATETFVHVDTPGYVTFYLPKPTTP